MHAPTHSPRALRQAGSWQPYDRYAHAPHHRTISPKYAGYPDFPLLLQRHLTRLHVQKTDLHEFLW